MNSFLEIIPLNRIAKFKGEKTDNAVAFEGHPRQHPSEKNKFLLVFDPLSNTPTVLEFKLEDVLYVDEISSPVTEEGEGIPLVRLWVRRKARGVILEPFEVGLPINFASKTKEIRERFLAFKDT